MAKNSSVPESISMAAKALRDGQLSCVGLAEAFIDRISQTEPTLNAFITVTGDHALATAKKRDAELASGYDRGQLHGIPVVYKDNIDTNRIRTTCGSAYFSDRIPQKDAAVVHILNQAGAIMLGKNNMHEFATGGHKGKNTHFGTVRNPLDSNREPGGSSSGTAAAVGAGLCLAGLGSDTGGSIRGPAAYVGITGLRPTLGLINVEGVFSRAPSFDCAGPLARTVADVAVLLEALIKANPDAAASTSPLGDLDKGVKGLRLGVVTDVSLTDVDTEVIADYDAAIAILNALGAEIDAIEISILQNSCNTLEFLDMLFYEFNENVGPLFDSCKDREKLFGPTVHADIEKGKQVKTSTYQKLQRRRINFTEDLRSSFSRFDAVLTPTMPSIAPLRNTNHDIPGRDRKFTFPFSIAGLPCISVPFKTPASLFPIGVQIIGDKFQEAKILRIAHSLQEAMKELTRP